MGVKSGVLEIVYFTIQKYINLYCVLLNINMIQTYINLYCVLLSINMITYIPVYKKNMIFKIILLCND